MEMFTELLGWPEEEEENEVANSEAVCLESSSSGSDDLIDETVNSLSRIYRKLMSSLVVSEDAAEFDTYEPQQLPPTRSERESNERAVQLPSDEDSEEKSETWFEGVVARFVRREDADLDRDEELHESSDSSMPKRDRKNCRYCSRSLWGRVSWGDPPAFPPESSAAESSIMDV
jgi:hypothetical protein